MAITTKKVLRMTFSNAAGKAVTISLNQPKEGITVAEIESVMDQIISKDIFFTSGGGLVSKRDIKIVDTTTEDLYEQPEG
ncbi:hypothetical protein DP73_03725 [Desulfosporosinus sp. HMP52]|uniref:DUF2922 domain-containing protein n=1 Tax=Desulfosporosinus sp. HMP52 TaxID=1487923 RepID=UPI00051FD43A|nr:DUF2922 domain-containing protein [Desulfosporosinus sp. HMP52]KGK91387.1 hypothetical protein DP73_03725 [Desulfosporosinus sp. HMP52]